MPRPKSGNPLWEPIAFKVPHEQLEELRRFADLHHMNISDVLREGMLLRLAQDGVSLPLPPTQRKEYNGYTSMSAEGESQPATAALRQEIREQLQPFREDLAAHEARLEAIRKQLQAVHERLQTQGEQLQTLLATLQPRPARPPRESPAAAAQPSEYGALRRQIEAALPLMPPRFTCDAMTTHLSGPRHGAVQQSLMRLVDEGVLHKDGAQKKATYRLAQREKAAQA